MTMSRRLYQLPQKQIERAERRQNYDRMKLDNSLNPTTATTTNAVVGTISANANNNTASLLQTAITTMTQPKQPQAIIATHFPVDIASLPLLQPFQIKKPAESSIVNTIINEQHANDTLTVMMNQEEKLRGDLQKAKNEDSKDNEDSNNDSTKAGKSTGNAKKSYKKSTKKQSNAANIQKIKEIECQIDTVSLTLHQCRQNLAQFTGWTKAMLQAEYSKLAVTLDQNSQDYSDLEEAFSFLCPRLTGVTNSDHEEYYHEQRLAYVKEMIPATKKAGERNFPTSLMALPYIVKFQCDDPESPVVAALIDEMHQLAITECCRARLEKQIASDPAKFKVLKHVEEMLDRKEVVTTEVVRKHYRKRSIKLHPDRNGEVSVCLCRC